MINKEDFTFTLLYFTLLLLWETHFLGPERAVS